MAASSSALGRFFGGILGIYRFIRSVIFNLAFLLVLLVVVLALVGKPPVVINRGTTLLLNPTGKIVEEESYDNPLELVNAGISNQKRGEVLLPDLLKVIGAAKDDKRISAMLIMTDALGGSGLSQLRDLEHAIADFRTSGKKVYALGSNFQQGQYLLASTADEILMNNFGEVALEGFGVWQNYFQNALTKLGVNVHIFRVGEYKSAVEPYSRNDMSPQSRANYTLLLNDLWSNYTSDIEANRKLAPGTINDYINHYDKHLADYHGNTADLAVALHLVDRIDSRPQAIAWLKQQIGTHGDDLNTVDYKQYLQTLRAATGSPANRIAVVVVDGEIVDGDSQQGSVGGDTISGVIRAAARDSSVKALVLRINSPGGSAFASEVIRAELAAFKASGRPIVVSMGDTAASGGYWIATPANRIFASPVTLTGSIGIFGAMFTLEESFNKLGIGTDGVSTTALAGATALGRPLPAIASAALQLQIQNGYERFITLVSESRDLDHGQVDAIAQGQVWSGKAALDKKLVDAFGTLQDAIAAAAKLANVDSYQVDVREPALSPMERVLKEMMDNSQVQALSHWLAIRLPHASPVQSFLHNAEEQLGQLIRSNDPLHVYARCLECSNLQL